ncbi:MAG: hypothetical protein J6T99_06290 [Oscillospiraceae bacterium]|nr:hypothetical protein [Oscillospiraceae bacterium]
MNPLFNMVQPVPQNQMITQLRQFMSTFNGDPRQQVQALLNSGRISQEQYNWAVQMTNQLYQTVNQPGAQG